MVELKQVILFSLVLLGARDVLADLDLSSSLHCTYQRGQFLSKDEAENVKNSTPMNWTFNSLSADSGMYISGGDSGEVMAITIENGMAIYIPYKIGTHTFTVWKTGESIWNKQSNLIGTVNSQQYLGNCKN